MAEQRITSARPEVTIAGNKVSDEGIEQFEVKADLDQPDMAEITISNVGNKNSTQFKPGDPVEIKMSHEGETPDTVFKGKVIAVHPLFDVHRPFSVTIRAMNDLHKLARERKTRTYVSQTDKQIVDKIAGEHGLTADFGTKPPTMTHAHVHQNNQTDLEFIRLRAARLNREVLVQDTKLYFRERETSKGAVVRLSYPQEGQGAGAGESGAAGGLEYFAPRMSAAGQVSKVHVYGWDPDKKERIQGEASAENSPLGQSGGGSAFGDSPIHHVHDVPVRTKEEADAVAKSILTERQMDYIKGTAVVRGNGKIKPGTVVEIKCFDTRFNGKYYVTGVEHRFTHSSETDAGGGAGMGGLRTKFQFKRDAEKGGGDD